MALRRFIDETLTRLVLNHSRDLVVTIRKTLFCPRLVLGGLWWSK